MGPDTASPPLLATLPRGGKNVPVVIQGNKTGFLYVLDRDTGKPVLPVEEREVPRSDIPGEKASPTQPFRKRRVNTVFHWASIGFRLRDGEWV